MKTIIKIEGKELFEFENIRPFELGEEVKCYGKPYIVVSLTNQKKHFRDEMESIVTILEKEEFNALKIDASNIMSGKITFDDAVRVNNVMNRSLHDNPFRKV